MRTKIFYLAFFVTVSYFSFGQRNIILTKYPQEVPKGKKWVLTTDKETLVEVSYGVLNSGSLCNAQFLSSPGIISGVVEGQFGNPNQVYAILFSSRSRVAYTNEYTFSIVPKAIITANFDFTELQTKKVDEVGEAEIAFLEGEKVYVGNCLTSLSLIESNLTKEDLQKIAKRNEIKEKEKAESIAKQNYIKTNEFSEFAIPINPEKYVPSGTTPKYQDDRLFRIKFKSDGVLHRETKGKGLSLDDQSSWTISLGLKDFSIESNRGYERDFTVISYRYDENMSSSKFELSTDSENITHELYVSWVPSLNQYSLLFKSKDNTEEFQFQEVKATEKNGKKVDYFPRTIGVKKVSEDFFIRKKKNSNVIACWVNEDKKVTNYSALLEHDYYRSRLVYKEVSELKISPDLIQEIKNNMADKESGDYFIGFDIEEITIEVDKGVFETKQKISLDQFFKGTYIRPLEIYKR